MLEFIQLIKQRYQTVLSQLDKKHPQTNEYQQRIEQLLYAEAFIRKGMLREFFPHFPLQIAVIGPTQVGKSSVVNLLLNQALAGVSPLAGYTVHPQGFCNAVNLEQLQGLQQYFGRFECLDRTLLSKHRFDCYSLTQNHGESKLLPNCICWDTPDFDSIDAADYREGVIRTVALADVVIIVVSKEKYADQSVWDVLQTIAGFKQPTLICLNKLTEGSEAALLNSFQQKWQQHRGDPVPEIVPLLFQKQGSLPVWPEAQRQAIFKLAKKSTYQQHLNSQQQWLQGYWSQWLEPLRAEQQALQLWRQVVDDVISQALKIYQRDYLDHPYHYETFQKALLKMLSLLEIPVFAEAAAKARRVMTWPVRKLLNLGKHAGYAPGVQETAVLMQIGEHVMIQLADKLLEKTETESLPIGWWKDTAVSLRQKRIDILQDYKLAVADYHGEFQANVDAAAHKLYRKLQDQPLVLNSLRATRATTDAAGLLLALQTGGIGLNDLFLTPMMLTITSLLAENAIGAYMGRVESELKLQQLGVVRQQLFENHLQHHLYQLAALTVTANRFNITDQQCSAAEAKLKEKKHGLRLL